MSGERVTLTVAATLCGVHRNTMRSWARSGKLTTARLDDDNKWRIDRTELEALGLIGEEIEGGVMTPATSPAIPEGYELVPVELVAQFERLMAQAAAAQEAGHALGRAEAERDTFRQRLDDARAEADELRAELQEARRRRWWGLPKKERKRQWRRRLDTDDT